MRLKSIRIEGFRSFGKEVVYDFPNGAGLYFLGGRNELYPELGANAVGKTSLWDAVIWVFTGKTARGQRAGNVAHWSGDYVCIVEVWFEHEGVGYALKRTWNPNSLFIREAYDEPEGVTQDALEKRFAYTHDTLTTTMVMSQFGQFFFDRGATDKLLLFSKLFDLEYWLQRAKTAAAQAKGARTQQTELGATVASLEGAQKQLQALVARVQERQSEWDQAHEVRVHEAQQDYEAGIAAYELAKDEAAAANKASRKARKRCEHMRELLVDADKELRLKIPIADRAHHDWATANRELKKLLREVQRVEDMGEGECPTCYSEVDSTHIARVVQELKDTRVKPARARVKKLLKVGQGTATQRTVAEDARSDAESKFVAAEKKSESLGRTASKATRERDRLKDRLSLLRQSAESLAGEANPHTEQLNEAEIDAKQIKVKLRVATKKLRKQTKLVDHFSYWAKTFKDLRLWLIERVLLDFEVCVNNALMELGLPDWSVQMDVEKETKSGTVSKGFTVLITSPESAEPVPWESWSGGETQRLRIAGAIGLSDLVQARTGFRPILEVWDEPTQHLSTEGIDDLLRFLKDRARSQDRQVWLVDHRTHSAGDFDGMTTVVLGDSGSTLE